MLKNYDPNDRFGEHVIEVTLQEWDYRGNLQVRVSGNCKGLSLISNIVDIILDAYPDHINSDCNFRIVEDGDEEWFEAELKNENGEALDVDGDWYDLEKMIVKVEIVDFIPKIA